MSSLGTSEVVDATLGVDSAFPPDPLLCHFLGLPVVRYASPFPLAPEPDVDANVNLVRPVLLPPELLVLGVLAPPIDRVLVRGCARGDGV